jgi:NAD(P)-dependent dehydrogenase (short-subunit alcohol dehydrogenase family)
MGPTLETTVDAINATFDTNVKGTIYMTAAVVPHMPHGGRIVNVSSTSSRLGQDTLPIYGASKAAIDSLTWSWAKEVRLTFHP